MRWIKVTLKVVGSIVAVLLILFLGIVAYVNLNKETVFRLLTEQLHENINGTIHIGRMKPTLIRGFPGVSILLQDVTLRDSLWEQHHNTLLSAKEIYVSINALAILKGQARIRDIHIKSGRVFLFTDSTGYSNTKIFFGPPADTTKKKKNLPRVAHLYFTDVEFVVENQPKFKYFQFDIKKLEATLDFIHTGWNANVYVKTQVKQMMFNTVKGSYLKDKLLIADLDISYSKKNETLTIPWHKIRIGKEVVAIKGQFVFTERPAAFELYINADNLEYKSLLTLLTPAIASKINKFDLAKPVDAQAVLVGHVKYRDTPQVVIRWQVKNNTFITAGGNIEQCSFNGSFNNERVKGAGHRDNNALVTLDGLNGIWSGIPFRADTVSITNLTNPVLEGRVTSKFDVAKLNPIIGDNTFHFDKGTVNVDILYKGGVNSDDTTYPYVVGYMQLADAAMTYLPRGLVFTNCGATLRFAGSDLYIDKVRVQRGTTKLSMDGSLMNFLNLYYTSPDKILLDWHVHSDKIDLGEFIPFLASRKATKEPDAVKQAKVKNASNRLDKMLAASSVHMRVTAARLVYHSFEGNQLVGDVSMASSGISINNLTLKHADGKLKVSAQLRQQGVINDYALTADVEHVNAKKFFTAFGNFGQDAITDKHVNGDLSANISVRGAMQDNGKLVPRAINGTTSFRFENGSLINFEPFRVIGGLLFRKRNLDSITFKEIDNKFDIKKDSIIIYPLFIESSALNMHIEGMYVIGRPGTDINIDIPLRNPDKDDLILNDELRRKQNMKGLVVHLKATDGADGKVKIKWNIQNKPAANGTTTKQARPKKSDRK